MIEDFHRTPEEVRVQIDPSHNPYRVLVTGPRDYPHEPVVHSCLWFAFGEAVSLGRSLTVVHGDCPTGADHQAHAWATHMKQLGYPVAPEAHPAQGHPTEDFGPWPSAGPNRNRYMASLGADVCYAFLKECSRTTCTRPRPHNSHGTAHCMTEAKRAGVPIRDIKEPS